ncbi:MAG: acyl-CoA carboxylase subunit epsilon [Actinobacteria bacterium]|nr:acyl-CoA carboxylase subunit epsilon [Actinomycetota bacterium]
MSESEAAPVLRVVRGEPSPEQLAVLTAVLLRSGGGQEPPEPESAWQLDARKGTRVLHPGPGVWQRSLRR